MLLSYRNRLARVNIPPLIVRISFLEDVASCSAGLFREASAVVNESSNRLARVMLNFGLDRRKVAEFGVYKPTPGASSPTAF